MQSLIDDPTTVYGILFYLGVNALLGIPIAILTRKEQIHVGVVITTIAAQGVGAMLAGAMLGLLYWGIVRLDEYLGLPDVWYVTLPYCFLLIFVGFGAIAFGAIGTLMLVLGIVFLPAIAIVGVVHTFVSVSVKT